MGTMRPISITIRIDDMPSAKYGFDEAEIQNALTLASTSPSSVATYAALAAVDATLLNTGAIRIVATTKRWFFLDKVTSRSSVSGEVIAAAGGGWWVWIPIREPFWLGQPTWTLDPSGGSDESTTTTIRSFAELDRRLFGFRGGLNVTVTLAGDIPASDAHVLRNVRTDTAGTTFKILGSKTLLGTYTLTSYSTLNTGTNQGIRVTATNIGTVGNVVAISMIDGFIQRTSDGVAAFIQRNNNSGEVNISEPTTANPATNDRGVSATFSNGDTVNVYSFSKLPFWPFGTDMAPSTAVIGNVYISDGTGSGVPNTFSIGSTAPRIIQCILDGGVYRGGQAGITNTPTSKGVFAGVHFKGMVEFVNNTSTLRSPSFTNCAIGLGSAAWTVSGITCMQKGEFNLGNFSTLAIGGSLACFDADGVLSGLHVGIFVTGGGSVRIGGVGTSSVIVGSGNTVYLMYGQIPTFNLLHVATNSFVTSEPNPLWLSGVEYSFADVANGISIDITTGSVIADHE